MPVYTTILVGTDGSETADRAVEKAAELAVSSDGKLVIVSAYRPLPQSQVEAERRDAPDDVAWAVNPREHVDAILKAAKKRAVELGAKDVETHAAEGSATDALLDSADSFEASVIIVGSVGLTGAKRFLLGSVPSRVTHHATVDVLVVRTG